MKNISRLMLALLISSFCIGATMSVTAISDQETISDGTGDIIDLYLEELVSSSPYVDIDNIDITQVTYSRENTQVTLTVTVNGIIENRGSLSDFNPNEGTVDFNINAVGYSFTLMTDNETYTLLYVNQACQLVYYSYSEIPVNLTSSDFLVSDNTLTIYFTLLTADELFEEVSAQSSYTKMQIDMDNLPDENANWEDFITAYTDDAPNAPLAILAEISNVGTTTGNVYLGTVGKSIQFNGTAFNGQPPYTYEWDFGDGTISTELNPTHVYQQARTYYYNFTVTDNAGTQESQGGSIVISADTPNGDGKKGIDLWLLITIILIIVVIGVVVIVLIIRR